MAEINGTPASESITGTAGSDSISAGAGDDTVNDNGGFDTISGGTGADQLKLSVGGLLFGDDGNDTLTGGFEESTNFLDGGPGDDRIDGGTLPFFAFVTYATATSGVHVDLGLAGPQDIGGGQGVDTLSRISQAVGSAFGDTITGGAGRDLIYGGDGDDSLSGGAGDDQLVGGTGNDVFSGGAGLDIVLYIAQRPFAFGAPTVPTAGSLHIDLSIAGPQDVGAGLGLDQFIGIEGLYGGGFADTLSGDAGANDLSGGAGNDSLSGAAGDDTLTDEAGNDTLSGGDGNDDIRDLDGHGMLRGGTGADTLTGGGGVTSGFVDINGNAGADVITGTAGDNWLRGGRDNDVISGNGGSDFISGDRGDDTVTGGAGADLFHGSQDAGIDKVMDFSLAEGDRVQLDPGTTYTLSQVGADTVLDMGGGNQMILVGVSMASLTPGSIFLG